MLTANAINLESERNGSALHRKPRVLLVDDSVDLLDVLSRALTVKGYTVTTAPNGTLALEKADEEDFDAIVTDIIMPEKEGLETIMAMRRKNPATRVVAMSGGGRINAEEQLVLAKKLGAIGTLKKPFGIDQLIHLLESGLKSAAWGRV